MEYDKAAINYAMQKSVTVGSPIGMLAGANTVSKPMPTVASALGSIDNLNGRLTQIVGQLAAIAAAVGSPYPVGASPGGTDVAQPSGMVFRLNDGAEYSHRQVSEIEELIGAISRALG